MSYRGKPRETDYAKFEREIFRVNTGVTNGEAQWPKREFVRPEDRYFNEIESPFMVNSSRIVYDLKSNHDLWNYIAANEGRDRRTGKKAFIMHIASSGKDDNGLLALVRTWGADEVRWVSRKEFGTSEFGSPLLVLWRER
jgi:hypothetical protein